MKFVPKTILAVAFVVVAMLCVTIGMASTPAVFDPPPPPTPPPPPGLPIDGGLWFLLAAAAILGLYKTYQYQIKKARV